MFRLNGELLDALIKRRFSSVENLLVDWEVRASAGEFAEERAPPNRSTLYRWIEGNLPRRETQLWRLCGLLDVDPFCLLQLPEGNERAVMQHLYSAFARNDWPPGLGFLGAQFGLQQIWPPPQLAKEYFRRNWFQSEVVHAGQRVNYPAQIEIKSLEATSDLPPQIFHFAYSSLERWVQYGVVERGERRMQLIQINGQIDRSKVDASGDSTIVETWFGQGACTFKVASLHPFSLKLREREDRRVRRIRFVG